MARTTKMIDVTRSPLPVNPNTFYPNMALSRYQDAPDQASSIVVYDGRNFLPTATGVRSYFGISRAATEDSLPSNADYVFCFQNKAYQNVLVALCEDGIYIKHGADFGSWVKKASVKVGDTYREWSYCVLGDSIYCYRTNDFVYYCIPSSLSIDHAALMTWTPAQVRINASETSDPYGLPAGSYRVCAAARFSTGWVSSPTEWSANTVTTNYTYGFTVFTAYQKNSTLISVRFYVDNGSEIRYKDVTPAIAHDSAVFYLTQAVWNSMQVVTSVPDEDWLSIPFTGDQPVLPVTPNFLNMYGQLGIFSAGTRLGFWDSEDSVSWSSIDSFTDFTPSLETLAGSSIFMDVQGRIVRIEQLGDGFVIYSTQSIVYVKKATSALLLWEPVVLLKAGISYRKQVVCTLAKKEHYAWTSIGLVRVSESGVEHLVPEMLDFMKQHNSPVYLDLLDERYLAIQVMDEGFAGRNVLSSVVTVPGQKYVFDSPVDVEYIQQALVSNLDDAALCAALATIPESQTSAYTNVGVNFGSYAPIYDWKLSAQNGYLSKIFDAPSLPAGSFSDELVVKLNGVEQPPVYSNTEPYKIIPRRAALSSPTDSYPFSQYHRVGNAFNPLSNAKAFVQAQTELWKRHDLFTKQMLEQTLNKTVTKTRTNRIEVTHYDLYGDTAAATSLRVAAHALAKVYLWPSLYSYEYANPSDHLAYSGRWVILSYGAPEIDVSECSLNLRRQCNMVGKLQTKISHYNTHISGAECSISYVLYRYNGTLGTTIQTFSNLEDAQAAVPVEESGEGVWEFDSGMWQFRDYATGSVIHNNIYPYATGHIDYETTMEWTPIIADVRRGAFHVSTASMVLTKWYNRSTYEEVPMTSSCSVPIRSALGAGTNQLPDNLDPTTGIMCGGASFNPYNITIDFNDLGVGTPLTWTPITSVTIPESEFMLQEGSPAPAYPDFYGSYIYDLFLKKWGRLDLKYKNLLNYRAINGQNGDPVAFNSYQTFSGVLDEYGIIRLFDDKPLESYVRYGKIGYSRSTWTNVEEVTVHNVTPCDFTITVEPSLDGIQKESDLKAATSFTDSLGGTLLANLSARWYNVVVSGTYNVCYLEFTAHSSGRR
jgi:hypothetical protein